MSMKAVYFLVLTGTAYYFLHEEPWWPSLLGGSGGEAALFTDHPYQQSHWFTHWYFYISAGYHLSCFLSLMLAPKLPDFFETLLLCVCGLLLIFFSYLGNFLRVGSIILFCHDFCDIFSCGCKVFVDTRHKLVTFCLFACLVISWGYLRLYTFPVATLFPIFKNVKDRKDTADNEGWGFFVFLLLTLFVMNIYWFGLMLKMCMHFCTSGQMSDLHTPMPGVSEGQELQTTKQDSSSVRGVSRTSAGGRNNQRGGSSSSCCDSRSAAYPPGGSQWFGEHTNSRRAPAEDGRSSSGKEEQKADAAAGSSKKNGCSATGSGNSTGSSTPGACTRGVNTATASAALRATAVLQSETTRSTSPSDQQEHDAANRDRRKSRERKKAFCYSIAEAESTEGELLMCSGSSSSSSSSSSNNDIVETSTGATRKLLAKAHA